MQAAPAYGVELWHGVVQRSVACVCRLCAFCLYVVCWSSNRPSVECTCCVCNRTTDHDKTSKCFSHPCQHPHALPTSCSLPKLRRRANSESVCVVAYTTTHTAHYVATQQFTCPTGLATWTVRHRRRQTSTPRIRCRPRPRRLMKSPSPHARTPGCRHW